jgi:hypothetical protein
MGLRFYYAAGRRRRKTPFPTKSAALAYFRDVIEPELRGDPVAAPELTLGEFVPLYLERHGASVRPRTIDALRWRLGVAAAAFGAVPLRDLERMSGEVASWRVTLHERSRFQITAALRQALGAAVTWGYMTQNPAKQAGRNPQPSPRQIRTFDPAELAAISAELRPATARYRRSSPRPGCGLRSGRRSSAAT